MRENPSIDKPTKQQLEKMAVCLDIPLENITEVVDDLIDMELLRSIKDDEWEVFDGENWQKLRL